MPQDGKKIVMSTISPIVGDINGKWNRTSCWILNMIYVCRIYHQYIHVFFYRFSSTFWTLFFWTVHLSLTFVAVAELFCFNIGDPNRQPTLFYSLSFLPVASLPMFVEPNLPLILRPFLGWCSQWICQNSFERPRILMDVSPFAIRNIPHGPISFSFCLFDVANYCLSWRITLKEKNIYSTLFFSCFVYISLQHGNQSNTNNINLSTHVLYNGKFRQAINFLSWLANGSLNSWPLYECSCAFTKDCSPWW